MHVTRCVKGRKWRKKIRWIKWMREINREDKIWEVINSERKKRIWKYSGTAMSKWEKYFKRMLVLRPTFEMDGPYGRT